MANVTPIEDRERRRKTVFSPRVPEELTVVDAAAFFGEVRNISLHGATLARAAGPLLVDGARVTRTDLSQSRFVRASMGDVIFFDCNLANARWSEAALTRVTFEECQMTGFDVNSSALLDIQFLRCKLSLSSFRFLSNARVQFAHCEMDGTDFQGVDLRRCFFDRCILTGSLFHEAKAHGLDLRGSSIAAVQGIGGLRGAVIDQLQLLDLAQALASNAGLVVSEKT
jgi:uncharacterized protein YjbI with pentapeptide repeats